MSPNRGEDRSFSQSEEVDWQFLFPSETLSYKDAGLGKAFGGGSQDDVTKPRCHGPFEISHLADTRLAPEAADSVSGCS